MDDKYASELTPGPQPDLDFAELPNNDPKTDGVDPDAMGDEDHA